MGTERLTRRAEQLRLLGRACESHVAAQIGPRRPGAAAHFTPTRFVALQPDSLMLEAPHDANLRNVPAGVNVEVIFEHTWNNGALALARGRRAALEARRAAAPGTPPAAPSRACPARR
jgi:hypothetical protein